MYSEYKLNKQGDTIQPWCTPFPIWNQSIFPCLVLTVVSWPAYRFLRRQVDINNYPKSKWIELNNQKAQSSWMPKKLKTQIYAAYKRLQGLPNLIPRCPMPQGTLTALQKGIATHSSTFAWRISWTEKPGGLQSMGSQRVGHHWATNTFTFQASFVCM